MNTTSSIWSKTHFRHRKGIPDIPYKSRPEVSIDWTDEIDRLQKSFSSIVLPVHQIKLNAWTSIVDLPGCIESGLLYVKANNGHRTFYPYFQELQEIELLLLPDQERKARKAELMPKPIEPIIQKIKKVNKPKNSVRKAKSSSQTPKCNLWDYQSFFDD